MYQIYYKGSMIYDPRLASQDTRYVIHDPDLHLAVGSSGRLSFTIDEKHPLRSELTTMSGCVEVKESGIPIFRGRIIADKSGFYNSKKIECEEKMACFNDSIVPPFSFPDSFVTQLDYVDAADSGNVVQFFLEKLISNHNAQVGPDQQIKLGNVTVSDPNNYIHRSSEKYLTTWEILDKKLQGSSLGGYLMLRYTEEDTYLDYVKDLPLTNIQKVEFAGNLLDMEQSKFGGDLYTAILPVGKEGLTIASLPDGPLTGDLVKEGAIIYDSKAQTVYGRITHIEEWDDVTLAENLRDKAAQQLAQMGVSMPEMIRCKACDLSGVDGSPIFRVGRQVEVISKPHGISATYPLMEIDIKLLDPGDTDIILTRQGRTFTAALDSQKTDILDFTESAIEKKTKEIMDQVKTISESLSTSIEQTASTIVVNALKSYVTQNELDTFKSAVSSQLTASAEEYNLKFTTVTEEISRVDGDSQKRYKEISVWFRQTADGMEIGKSDSTIKLILKNDRISFVDNGYEVAYFMHNKLYVTSAEFLTKLILGNFAWVVREAKNIALVKEA